MSSLTTKVAPSSPKARPRSTTSAVDALTRSWITVAPAATASRAVSRSATIACTLIPPPEPPSNNLLLARFGPGAGVEGCGVERREGVVEVDVEAARPLRIHRCIFACDAECDKRLDRGVERSRDGEEAPGHGARHAARAGDRREQRMAVRDCDDALAVGDMVDRAGHGCDHAELGGGGAGDLGGVAAADRLDATDLGVDTD